MTVVAWFRSIHHPLRLVKVFPMSHNGRTWPEAGRGPLVVEVWRDSPLHLLPVAEVERGSVKQVVVAGGEAVDEVEGEAANEGDEGVLGDPPHLVGEEGGGEGAGYEAGVVGADDRVEENLLESCVEVCLGDGHLHPDQLRRGWNATCSRQVCPEGSRLVLIDLHPPLAPRCEVYEWRGRGPKQDEVHGGRVDQVEDVDHAVCLYDEICKVAQGEEDQPYHAELGAIDEPAGGRHRQKVDNGGTDKVPQETSAEENEGEEDGERVDQVEVDRLAGVRVGQPPNCAVQVEVLEAEGCRCVEEDDDLEGEGGVVGDVGDWNGLWVGEWTRWIRLLPSFRPEGIHSFDLQPLLTC